NQGTTCEALNLATVWKLPAIFVFENNGYAEATSSKYSVSCKDIVERAQGFGMPGVMVDGHDFFAVWEAAREAIDRARSGGGPTLIEVKLNRYYGHFEGDAQTYRAPGEVDAIRAQRDSLDLFRNRVTEAGLLDIAQMEAIDAEIKQAIERAVVDAKAAAVPGPADLLTDVYVSY
ncbi:MAG TPA: thiamine pyrophosphate-dependent enzyme, partial [Inquilinus sp.]